MNPILFDFGLFQISWYSICILTAIFIGGFLMMTETKRLGIDVNYMTNLIFWTVIFGVIGARLYYVIFNWSYYSLNLTDIFKIWEGGLAIHGAIIAGLAFILLYTKRYKVKTLLILDIAVTGAIIGQAIGRWGNFFNQEAYGGAVSRTFLENLHLPNFIINGMNIYGIYYHPTFLYESLWCVLGFVLLLIMRRRKYIKIGQLTGIYFMWYSIGRFFIEALRTDSLMLGTIKMAQLVSIVLFIIGLGLVYTKSRGSKFENLYNGDEAKNEVRF